MEESKKNLPVVYLHDLSTLNSPNPIFDDDLSNYHQMLDARQRTNKQFLEYVEPNKREMSRKSLKQVPQHISPIQPLSSLMCSLNISGSTDSSGNDSFRSQSSIEASFHQKQTNQFMPQLLSSGQYSEEGINKTSKKRKESSIRHCRYCFKRWQEVCRAKGKPQPKYQDDGPWRSHTVRDRYGNIRCPQLWFSSCQACFATGSNAHSTEDCPNNQFRKTHLEQRIPRSIYYP